MLLVVFTDTSSYSSDEDGVDSEDEDWIGKRFRACCCCWSIVVGRSDATSAATGATRVGCCGCCWRWICSGVRSATKATVLASEESRDVITFVVAVVVVDCSPSRASGCGGDSGPLSSPPAVPVPVPMLLLVRDDGDSDDTVVGDDDEEAESSTSVDSSSSSAPMIDDEDDGKDAAVVVEVVVVVAIVVVAVV